MRVHQRKRRKTTMRKLMLNHFLLGLAGPALLVNSVCDLRGFERGASVAYAWSGAGRSLSSAWGRITDGENAGAS